MAETRFRSVFSAIWGVLGAGEGCVWLMFGLPGGYDGVMVATTKNYKLRQLPKTPWLNAMAVLAFAIVTALLVLLSAALEAIWLAWLPGLCAIPLGLLWFWVRRCPECGSRLATHRKLHPYADSYRVVSRCRQCLIDWDTGYSVETKGED